MYMNLKQTDDDDNDDEKTTKKMNKISARCVYSILIKLFLILYIDLCMMEKPVKKHVHCAKVCIV